MSVAGGSDRCAADEGESDALYVWIGVEMERLSLFDAVTHRAGRCTPPRRSMNDLVALKPFVAPGARCNAVFLACRCCAATKVANTGA